MGHNSDILRALEYQLEHEETLGIVRRRCQFCKQIRDCTYGPDPFLYHNFDEIEMVWLCDECRTVRENGEHLPDGDDGEALL